MTQRFRIEMTLPGLNEVIDANRRGKHVGARLKADAERGIMAYARRARIEPMQGPVVMRYTWVEANRRRDKDNIASARKFVQDALVKAGILAGDGWKHIAGFSDAWEVDATNPGVIVEIEEAGA